MLSRQEKLLDLTQLERNRNLHAFAMEFSEAVKGLPMTYGTGNFLLDSQQYLQTISKNLCDTVGKEAVLICASPQQAHMLAYQIWTRTRHKILELHAASHIARTMSTAILTQLGCSTVLVETGSSIPVLEDFVSAAKSNWRMPACITVEPCMPALAGCCVSWDTLTDLREYATESKVPLHLDGTRLHLAAEHYGKDIASVCALFDSVVVAFPVFTPLPNPAPCAPVTTTEVRPQAKQQPPKPTPYVEQPLAWKMTSVPSCSALPAALFGSASFIRAAKALLLEQGFSSTLLYPQALLFQQRFNHLYYRSFAGATTPASSWISRAKTLASQLIVHLGLRHSGVFRLAPPSPQSSSLTVYVAATPAQLCFARDIVYKDLNILLFKEIVTTNDEAFLRQLNNAIARAHQQAKTDLQFENQALQQEMEEEQKSSSPTNKLAATSIVIPQQIPLSTSELVRSHVTIVPVRLPRPQVPGAVDDDEQDLQSYKENTVFVPILTNPYPFMSGASALDASHAAPSNYVRPSSARPGSARARGSANPVTSVVGNSSGDETAPKDIESAFVIEMGQGNDVEPSVIVGAISYLLDQLPQAKRRVPTTKPARRITSGGDDDAWPTVNLDEIKSENLDTNQAPEEEKRPEPAPSPSKPQQQTPQPESPSPRPPASAGKPALVSVPKPPTTASTARRGGPASTATVVQAANAAGLKPRPPPTTGPATTGATVSSTQNMRNFKFGAPSSGPTSPPPQPKPNTESKSK